MKKILMAASGIIHPPFRAVKQLQKAIEKKEDFTLDKISSLEKMPQTMDGYSAIVLYFHQKKISDTALDRLLSFISDGGGLLGIHSATASFKQNDRYFDLLGGRFSHHGKVEPITIEPVRTSQVFTQASPITIRDELYFHDLKDDISIHYTAAINGKRVPIIWTRQQENGRVCYAMPGHTESSIKHPGVQDILFQALDWITRQ